MSGASAQRRAKAQGQPLFVLMALLLGWAGLRAALWEDLHWPAVPHLIPTAASTEIRLPAAPPSDAAPQPLRQASRPAPVLAVAAPRPAYPSATGPAVRPELAAAPPPLHRLDPAPFGGRESPHIAAGHQLAWMAGIAQLPMPRLLALGTAANPAPRLVPGGTGGNHRAGPAAGRWSVEGWLLLREGGAGLTAAGLPSPIYGASQAGAVIRYRLAPASPRHTALYLRATSALDRPRGEEAALGLSARPIPAVPLALHAELRLAARAGGPRLRPAVGAVTELPRLALPGGFSAEIYGQAGYVGGADASLYADGQVRVERAIGGTSGAELRAGLGAWGGAQRGARRLDVGPTATILFPIGAGHGRVSADWRLRAGGNAAPRSGPAITLSAGF